MKGFPKRDWLKDMLVTEFVEKLCSHEKFLGENLSKVEFTHDLLLKSGESGGYSGCAPAYFVGQAAFLTPVPPASSQLYGFFWIGYQDPSHCHFRAVPSALLVVPTTLTLAKAAGNAMRNMKMTVQRSGSLGACPPVGSMSAKVLFDIPRCPGTVCIRLPAKVSVNRRNRLLESLLTQGFYSSPTFDGEAVESWMQPHDIILQISSVYDGKFLEYSFPD